MDEYIEEIINEKVEKLDIDEFKEWLQQNKIEEKDNFVNLLVEFVKSELEKDNGDSVRISVEIKELIKELIECLSNEENEKNYFMSYEENAIKLLIDYFISKWNKKIENLKFMYLVSNLLPYLIEKSYKVQIDELIPKLDYVEIPEIKFKSHELVLNDSTRKLSLNISTHNKFLSTRKNLCGYEFPTTSKGFKFSKTSILNRLYKFTSSCIEHILKLINDLLYKI
jgi:hypothetical protein